MALAALASLHPAAATLGHGLDPRPEAGTGEAFFLGGTIALAAAAAALAMAWPGLRDRLGTGPHPPPEAGRAPRSLVERGARQRQDALWFVRLRWFAAAVSLSLILGAVELVRLLPRETLVPLLAWWGVLVTANVAFSLWARRGNRPQRQIVVQALTDLVVLTGFLNASGGIENPLYIAYLFHVIIGGILLPRRKAVAVTAAAVALFTSLAVGEYLHVLPHYTNVLFPHQTEAEHVVGEDPGHGSHAAHSPVFVAGRVLPFLAVMGLVCYLTVLVAQRLRRSESELEATARAALLEHQRLAGVVGATGVGMILYDPDRSVQWFNRTAAEWLQWDEHTLGEPCPLAGSEGGCRSCLVVGTFETGRPGEVERAVPSPGGGLRYFRHATSPVRDPRGRIVQVVELIEDITARKALEARALHTSRLAVLGRMAAGIAHEIGNPLASLTARLKLLERRPEPSFLRDSLAVLQKQIDRIRTIVHGVSQFARARQSEWSLWELNAAVEEALDMIRLDRRAKGVEFRTRFAEPSPQVRGVRDQMIQVCVNLLLNAVEAIPDGGTILVETFHKEGEVGFAVTDGGTGMGPETLSRLFEPFFTTKPEGTGLGLSISYSLVHAHRGRIDIETEVERGSRFTVSLPAAEVLAPTLPEVSAP